MTSYIDRSTLNLLRFPLVVLIEIFKNMDFREKFLISLLSKRARNTLKLTCLIPHLSFRFEDSVQICLVPPLLEGEPMDHIIKGEEMRLSVYSNGVVLQDKSLQDQLLLTNRVLNSFRTTSISLEFHKPTLPALVLEFMRKINQRKLCVQSFSYNARLESSEIISSILDECTEVTGLIWMLVGLPYNYAYKFSSPFKAKGIYVGTGCFWFNTERQRCSHLIINLCSRTAICYNSFFTNWIGSDTRLEHVSLIASKESENKFIMDALNNQGTLLPIADKWIEMKRIDGSEFFIHTIFDYIQIYTKQAYLEKVRKNEG
uniref:F-box domain-containing protein n=1 Tax=Caenorhabditis tropicalis TaxID=1561998 RepID=A0A1I7UEI3_9PELO